jgi:hypothetical protein
MTKRFEDLTNFMEGVRALTEWATELDITSETISHMCALDPEFAHDAENIITLFSNTETATTSAPTTAETEETEEAEKAEEEHQPEVAVETAPEIAVPKMVPVEAIKANEVWKNHPDLKGVEVSTLGHVRVNGNPVEPRMIGGYMKFYHTAGKYYALAAAVLTTFSGHTDHSMVPIYKDGNKENCSLDNLHWGLKDCTLSASAVERACKLIAENPKLNEAEMLNLLVREKTIRSVVALRSILSGNWRTISDRYFVVRRGSIIPTTTTTMETAMEATTATTTTIQPAEPEVDDSGNLKGILSLTNDPAFVRKLYGERVDAKKVSADDNIALILSYIMDGKENAGAIQHAIRKDFGKRVMISNAEIQRIIG